MSSKSAIAEHDLVVPFEKCVTVCQPYSHLIMIGEKRVENRPRAYKYRGPLLIHAGKSREWLNGEANESLLRRFGKPLVFGAIEGRAQLIDCLHIDAIEDGEYDSQYPWLRNHEHTHGEYCWILDKVERFLTPIPYIGKQGIFHVPSALVCEVKAERVV